MRHKFMIHFHGAFHPSELYSRDKGDHVYELDEAIEEAKAQYPDAEFEVYSGHEAWETEGGEA